MKKLDTTPNEEKRIEDISKKIANYRATHPNKETVDLQVVLNADDYSFLYNILSKE